MRTKNFGIHISLVTTAAAAYMKSRRVRGRKHVSLLAGYALGLSPLSSVLPYCVTDSASLALIS